ncbi:DUF3237 domain-containing protein [Tsuneonella sp. HG222]
MRGWFVLASAVLLAAPGAAQEQPAPPAPPAPGLELLYRSVVKLSPAVEVGQTQRGKRRFIPIIGGTFEGPRMKGEILPMGWDWQLDTPDGCSQIVADYFIKTDDGVIINVVNSGALCRPVDGQPVAPIRTSPVFEAPLGKYDWLNKGAYIGTLGFDPTVKEPAVVITIYKSN